MPGHVHHSAATSLTIVVAGAGLFGLLAWLVAPSVFPAALIGGALAAGAIRVAWILFRTGRDDGDLDG